VKRPEAAGLAMLLSAACSLSWYLFRTLPSLGTTRFDDAYVFLRYAKHYLAGHGFVWNVDDGPAYGATSTLYLFLITALRAATRLPDATLLTTSSFVAAVVACVLLVALGLIVMDDNDPHRSWLPWLVVPLLLLSPTFGNHSRSGMDTTVSLLCNTLLVMAVASYCRHPSRLHLAWCLLAGYASFLVRPDNGLYCLIFPPFFFVASDRRLARDAALYTVILAALLVPDLLLKRALFGSTLPLPFYAKRAGAYVGYLGASKWNPVAYTFEFLSACLPFLIVIASVARASAMRRLAAVFIPVAVTLAYFATVNQIMGFDARYYYPSLPFVILASFVAIQSRRHDGSGRASPNARVLRALALLALVLLGLDSPVRRLPIRAWQHYVIGAPVLFEPQRRYASRSRAPLPELGWWEGIVQMTALLERVPGNTVFAASEHGYIGSRHAGMAIIDLNGLNDVYIARHGFSADYVFSKEVDVLWMPHPDYSFAVKEILDAPRFADDYEYYPGAYDYGVALRKTSPIFTAVKAAFAKEWARLYPGREMADYVARPVDARR
jgi:hypothetical protein